MECWAKVSTGPNHLLDFEKDWGLGQDVLARVLARSRRINLVTDVRGWLKSPVLVGRYQKLWVRTRRRCESNHRSTEREI